MKMFVIVTNDQLMEELKKKGFTPDSITHNQFGSFYFYRDPEILNEKFSFSLEKGKDYFFTNKLFF